MKKVISRFVLIIGLIAIGCIWNGEISPTSHSGLLSTAEAIVGAPATPVSYAGVARRSTVGAGSPGVGVSPGVGAGAPGVGAAPANVGGPVNRVGVR